MRCALAICCLFFSLLSLSFFITKASAEEITRDVFNDTSAHCQAGTTTDSEVTKSLTVNEQTNEPSSSSACLLCSSWQFGYLEGKNGKNFTGDWFKCNNPYDKASAIQAILNDYGLGNEGSCSGLCLSGSCIPTGLTSANNDGCELELERNEENEDQCRYKISCGGSHTPDFKLLCGCR